MREAIGNRRTARLLCALTCLFTLAGCGQELSWRQKLTLEVETPDGVKTGSSVIRVTVRDEPRIIAHAGGIFEEVSGEAALVEVAPGRYLFALLGNEGTRARRAFVAQTPPDGVSAAYEELADFTGSAVLPREAWPRLVTFTDIGNPATVRRVDPDDLAASFGPGYRLNPSRWRSPMSG